MAKTMSRSDAAPWQKVRVLKSLKPYLEGGETLSSSLRNTKYSPIGGRVKKPAVDWMCSGKQRPQTRALPKNSVSFVMQLKSRMMVNHAGGVMENAGLAFHPHFGTPSIPGSAIKGIARHAAWCDWKDADEDDQPLYASLISDIFGYPTGDQGLDKALKSQVDTRSGAIAFLSAETEEEAHLEADLVNSHTGNKPIPVFFPAVAAGTRFVFTFVPLQITAANDVDTLLYFAEDWLKKGLREHGAGAKTNAGYGWFEEVDNV